MTYWTKRIYCLQDKMQKIMSILSDCHKQKLIVLKISCNWSSMVPVSEWHHKMVRIMTLQDHMRFYKLPLRKKIKFMEKYLLSIWQVVKGQLTMQINFKNRLELMVHKLTSLYWLWKNVSGHWIKISITHHFEEANLQWSWKILSLVIAGQ